MLYNFDEIIPRKGTNCLKYDFALERGLPHDDLIPLWVADMDFPAPREVIEQLLRVARHGVFGYSEAKGEYFQALQSWFSRYFAYEIHPRWLVKTPGVVFALSLAVRALSNAGDSVIIQEPVYYPFAQSVRANGRRLIYNSLLYRDGKYQIDLADFEAKIRTQKVKLFILCSPHNPVGRVWSEDELRAMAEICLKYDCYIVSDEIHCDFVYSGHKHHVLTTVAPQAASRTVICTAPSKTFNLAGLQVSNIFIQNEEIREKFRREMAKTGYSQLNVMGLAACQCAYRYGHDWLGQLLAYLENNFAFMRGFIEQRIPALKMAEAQGTYLAWVDFRNLGLSHSQINDLIINRAKLWLDEGMMFGPGGQGFQRFNLACPQAVLARALTQLEKALKSLGP
ncbi:MAG: pyridoxal phosphate-dependent aminotransferase [Desulfarculales bacterium]|jgi:cystathionine beta-lyase|nr:pyridoxal phosphate-dependent aminotransferase [Desulfarculales bacterium]